ncbi:mucin TcMUC, partial [Trypanosoma cruzi]
MRAHARRAHPGVPIVGEGLTCGCQNGATVFLAGASRAGRHRSCQACQQAGHAGSTSAGTRDGPGASATASYRIPRAADPTTDHGRLCLIHCGNALVVGNMDCDCFGLPQPARRPVCDGILATFVRTVFALLTRYYNSIQQQQNDNLLCDEYWLHFLWTNNPRGVRGSPPFLLLLCFRVAVCAAPPLVCVRTLREGCRHDG